jgi:hypothetical protein
MQATSSGTRALDIQPPLSVATLCAALGKKRGRLIEPRPYPLPMPGPLGLWFELPEVDLVLYQQATTKLPQDHIILHEVMGHIFGDHQSDDDGARWDVMIPGLKPSAVDRVFRRCSYDDEQECEAELAATIILAWASVLDRVTSTRAVDPAVQRVHRALGDRRGWLG